MNIYIDESGSINNHQIKKDFFIIAIVCEKDKSLKNSYKRFVKSQYDNLIKLDSDSKENNKMFDRNGFKELKGSKFNPEMKKKFIHHFSQKNNFDLFYIIIDNSKLNDKICQNTARAFNYFLKSALEYFIRLNYIPKDEDLHIQLDERNEKTESKHFLQDYLNTELGFNGIHNGKIDVKYFDSSKNTLIQVADVFSNIMYSHKLNGYYDEDLKKLKEADILKQEFVFPKNNNS
ncbi:MAG: DUF3800 domain-containing protein [Oscillospiraceae bacterium]|nr:DUF3800 domain-containing protein [Oscillospiraceae bacterium]